MVPQVPHGPAWGPQNPYNYPSNVSPCYLHPDEEPRRWEAVSQGHQTQASEWTVSSGSLEKSDGTQVKRLILPLPGMNPFTGYPMQSETPRKPHTQTTKSDSVGCIYTIVLTFIYSKHTHM